MLARLGCIKVPTEPKLTIRVNQCTVEPLRKGRGKSRREKEGKEWGK